MFKRTIFLVFALFSALVYAGQESGNIFSMQVAKAGEEVYPAVYKSLEASRFYVIFEANIGKNLARNAERWGEDYNRNNFDMVKSMIICNPYFANQVLNLDPEMMALCPLTVTVLSARGNSTVLFQRLTPIARDSAAADVLWEVENTVITAIENALAD